MFEPSRVFSYHDNTTGAMGWFYETREGMMGPFDSERLAFAALQKHVEHCKQQHLDGGRRYGVPHVTELKLVEWC